MVASLENLLLSVVPAENHREGLQLRSGLCSGLNACHVLSNHILSATLATFVADCGRVAPCLGARLVGSWSSRLRLSPKAAHGCCDDMFGPADRSMLGIGCCVLCMRLSLS